MNDSISDQTTTRCPEWCVSHYEVEGQPGVVIHDGERQTFGKLMTTIGEKTEPTVIYQTLTTLPDGTTCEDGMVLNDIFLGVEDMEALVTGLQKASGVRARPSVSQSTWENYPNTAAALAMGDPEGAAEAFLEQLEEERTV